MGGEGEGSHLGLWTLWISQGRPPLELAFRALPQDSFCPKLPWRMHLTSKISPARKGKDVSRVPPKRPSSPERRWRGVGAGRMPPQHSHFIRSHLKPGPRAWGVPRPLLAFQKYLPFLPCLVPFRPHPSSNRRRKAAVWGK